MFGMLEMLDPEARKRRARWKKEEQERRIPLCVPWDPKARFKKELNFKAETYLRWDLFPGVTPHKGVIHPARIVGMGEEFYRLSADGVFMYTSQTLPRGEKLDVYYGKQKGTVMFDGDVVTPLLYRKEQHGRERWEEKPWMSTTPMEVFSLRGGTRLAKGHVVVAGLGLGYQLTEVTRRKQVSKVTLVEVDQNLVDMIMPSLCDRLGKAPVEIVVGDANQVVPTLTADVALIDIFHGYGGNEFLKCPNIPRVWCWGSQFVEGSNSLWG